MNPGQGTTQKLMDPPRCVTPNEEETNKGECAQAYHRVYASVLMYVCMYVCSSVWNSMDRTLARMSRWTEQSGNFATKSHAVELRNRIPQSTHEAFSLERKIFPRNSAKLSSATGNFRTSRTAGEVQLFPFRKFAEITPIIFNSGTNCSDVPLEHSSIPFVSSRESRTLRDSKS